MALKTSLLSAEMAKNAIIYKKEYQNFPGEKLSRTPFNDRTFHPLPEISQSARSVT